MAFCVCSGQEVVDILSKTLLFLTLRFTCFYGAAVKFQLKKTDTYGTYTYNYQIKVWGFRYVCSFANANVMIIFRQYNDIIKSGGSPVTG